MPHPPGAERFLFLGDHCAIGPEPSAVLERIARLPDAMLTRGTTDRYVVTGDGLPPGVKAVREDPDLIPLFAQIAASFAWSRGHVTGFGWPSWLETLPLEIRTELGRIRVLVYTPRRARTTARAFARDAATRNWAACWPRRTRTCSS